MCLRAKLTILVANFMFPGDKLEPFCKRESQLRKFCHQICLWTSLGAFSWLGISVKAQLTVAPAPA